METVPPIPDAESQPSSTSLWSRPMNVFAAPGEVLPPPLRGVCRPIGYTLEFAAIPTEGPLVLAVTGLLEFGTASSNIALSQTSSASFVWPTLEAEGADGRWRFKRRTVRLWDGEVLKNFPGRGQWVARKRPESLIIKR